MSDRLLKVPQALDKLQCSRSTLYDLIETGEVRTVHIGRAVRIPLSEIESYITRHLAVQEVTA